MRQYIDELSNTYDEREMAEFKDAMLPMLKAWNDSMAEKIKRVKERTQKSSEM
jgi:predicted transcriptional regulator